MRSVASTLTLCFAACAGTPTPMKSTAAAVSTSAPASERLDVHSRSLPDEARTTHLSLDWSVDFDRRELSGTATLTLARAPGAARCVLDTKELAIESVSDTS